MDMAVVDGTKMCDFMISYVVRFTTDKCTDCHTRFNRNDMRIMRSFHSAEADENQNFEIGSGQANWYHVACFVRERSQIGWLYCGNLLPGFKHLEPKDRKIIRNQIPWVKLSYNCWLSNEITTMNIFCRKTPPIAAASSSNNADLMDLEKQIQIQNNEYFEVYDYIKKYVTDEDQIAILNCNKQSVPDADDQVNSQAFNWLPNWDHKTECLHFDQLIDAAPFGWCHLLWCLGQVQRL